MAAEDNRAPHVAPFDWNESVAAMHLRLLPVPANPSVTENLLLHGIMFNLIIMILVVVFTFVLTAHFFFFDFSAKPRRAAAKWNVCARDGIFRFLFRPELISF